MGRNLGPKSKQERREGMSLFLKGDKNLLPKNPVIKRPFPPGMHGPNMKSKRLSGYGIRLREKQKAKKIYRLLEKEFHNYFVKANRLAGDTSENLLRLLETRFDNIVYRLGFADSRDQARQLVSHGHFLLNGKKAHIPSNDLKVGDIITLGATGAGKKYWQERIAKLAKVETPGWVALNPTDFSGKVISLPAKADLIAPFDATLIIEFYSR
ncbi:MAG: 30S ribosomal protein S4 [Patescibacteria group bacterium]|jgi:small subunit ribosomal protein S4